MAWPHLLELLAGDLAVTVGVELAEEVEHAPRVAREGAADLLAMRMPYTWEMHTCVHAWGACSRGCGRSASAAGRTCNAQLDAHAHVHTHIHYMDMDMVMDMHMGMDMDMDMDMDVDMDMDMVMDMGLDAGPTCLLGDGRRVGALVDIHLAQHRGLDLQHAHNAAA